MKTLKVQTLRGPNYWSSQHPKLVVFLLDLEDLVDKPLQLPGFLERLTALLASLGEPDSDSHRCIQYLSQQGMTIAHGVEQVALVLQQLAGMAVGFGHTQAVQVPGVYQVVVEYLDEAAGRYAARAAVRLCQSIVDTGSYPWRELERDLRDLKELWAEASLGPSTETLVAAAEARGIPWLALSARSMIQLGYGKYQKRIQATLSDRSGILGVELASDKESTKKILQAAGIPVPRGTVIYYLDELPEAVAAIGGFPIVIKPLNGNHGRGITLNIDSWDLAEAAYNSAKDISRGVIVEHYYPGYDHRVLVVNGKVVAVAERVPAHVVGDGKSTIEELIESTNQDPQRGEGHQKVLTRIEIDPTTRKALAREGYTLETVLPPGKVCYLRATANLSTGGTAIDRTEDIHPENIWLAERAAQIIGLDIAGIDIVTADISRPLREVNGAVVEVNAAPGLRMHTCPSQGTPRNVAEPILDMLFPPGAPSQIPIIAVAGSQGKTITTQLIAQIFKQTQQTVGYTTSTGTYINDFTVDHTLGLQNTQVILQDPTVEIAVLETATREILQSGLSFAACDVSVVLNIANDPGGAGEMTAMEARLNSVVASSAVPSGYVVLNADEPQIATIGERVRAQVAYFTLNPGNPLVQAHIQQGGLAAIYENGYLAILKGDWQLQIERAANIPLTRGRQPSCRLGNALAASLAAFVQGVSIEEIRAGLTSLSPAAESQLTPTHSEDDAPPAPDTADLVVGQFPQDNLLVLSANHRADDHQPETLLQQPSGHLEGSFAQTPLPAGQQNLHQSGQSGPVLPYQPVSEPMTPLQDRLTAVEQQLAQLQASALEPEPQATNLVVPERLSLGQSVPEHPLEPNHQLPLLKKLAKPAGKGLLISVGLTAGMLLLASVSRTFMPMTLPVLDQPSISLPQSQS